MKVVVITSKSSSNYKQKNSQVWKKVRKEGLANQGKISVLAKISPKAHLKMEYLTLD